MGASNNRKILSLVSAIMAGRKRAAASGAGKMQTTKLHYPRLFAGLVIASPLTACVCLRIPEMRKRSNKPVLTTAAVL
jgi:hypothetical protein